MPRGGKREGAGRKPVGITKKVSLTLTSEEWERLKSSGFNTVSAFVKNALNQVTSIKEKKKTSFDSNYLNHITFTRQELDEWLSIYGGKDVLPDVAKQVRDKIMQTFFPDGSDRPHVRTFPYLVCPFTGKRFASVLSLMKNAIPFLIRQFKGQKE